MTRKQSILLLMAGAALAATSSAQAQKTAYSDQDLLLNFRDASSQSPANVAVDLGNAAGFVSTVYNLPGSTAVLDVPGATAGYTDQFTASSLLSTVGTPATQNQIGFSVGAEDPSSDTLWLSRQITGPDFTGTDLTPSAKQLASVQLHAVQQLQDIGLGYNSGAQLGSGNAATVASGNLNSYYSLTVDGTGTMDFKGYQSPSAGAGGPIEVAQTGSGNVYAALWEVPPATSIHGTGGGADTYEGFFTFKTDGEVDFTAVVPEPSTYALFGGGFLALVIARRKFHSLAA